MFRQREIQIFTHLENKIYSARWGGIRGFSGNFFSRANSRLWDHAMLRDETCKWSRIMGFFQRSRVFWNMESEFFSNTWLKICLAASNNQKVSFHLASHSPLSFKTHNSIPSNFTLHQIRPTWWNLLEACKPEEDWRSGWWKRIGKTKLFYPYVS